MLEQYLDPNTNYFYPFRYTDPTLGNKEECYLLKSDEHYVHFLHPYTYRYLKHKDKIDTLKNFKYYKSLYLEHPDVNDTDFLTYETLYCRQLPPHSMKGKHHKEIGHYMPEKLLQIELPENILHHINIIFEIYGYLELHYYRTRPKLDWIVYAADKISTLPISIDIKHILFDVLCKTAVAENETNIISLTIKFHSDKKEHNPTFYELLDKHF